MQRMRGSDAFSIYSESPTSPFVTLKVAIYRPADGNDVPDISEIRQFVEAAIATTGTRRAALRIMRVPFDLHHPVWVADPAFSLDRHIHYATLPAPGRKAQLCDFLSDLMGKPLQHDRPLWEIWLLEGLEHAGIAVAIKIHHSLADGRTVAALIEKSHAQTRAGQAPPVEVVGEPIPDESRLIRDAMVDLFKSYTVELPHYYRYIKQARQASAALRGAREIAPQSFAAPYTVLNRKGGRDRVYRYESFALSAFRTLSKIFDCTINTLILGVCSEALRRYLLEVDTLPSIPLTTAVPVGDPGGGNLDTLLHSDIHNNNLAVAVVCLHNDIDDFRERLQAIKRSANAALADVRRSNGRRFDNYLDFLPGTFIRLVHSTMDWRQAHRKNLLANLVISNVVGPRETLYALDGRLKMVELLSTGNLQDAGNLNITVWSYVDNLCFSFYSRKGVLPGPEKINGHLRDVVEELQRQYLAGKASPRTG